MEGTTALLTNLMRTKSIEHVLAPIAAQVSQLIIVNEAFEQGDTEAFPSDLVGRAEIVQKSAEGLISVANRMSAGFKDQELQMQLLRACDSLGVAGSNLVTACYHVASEDFSPESRRHLIRMAKDVLEGTLKVLLVSDEANTHRIHQAGSWVKEKLGVLTIAKSMQLLVPAFKAFVEASMVFSSLVDERQKDMTRPQQREMILSELAVIKRAVPMLSSTLQTCVKYPENPTAKTSRDYVVGQLLNAVGKLHQLVEGRSPSDTTDREEPGHFVTKIDLLIGRLSEECRLDFTSSASEMDAVMEPVVRHCMAVAYLSTDRHRQLIVKNCHRVLQQRNEVADLARNVIGSPDGPSVRVCFDEGCERLIDEVQDLERHINTALLHLFVDVFKETTQPLDRLFRATLDLQQPLESEALKPYIDVFHDHADLLGQIAQYIAASSSDAARVREIMACVQHMDLLDPELVPAVQGCLMNREDKAALEQLQLLQREWRSNLDMLVEMLDSLAQPSRFLQLTVQQLQEKVDHLIKCQQMEAGDILVSSREIIALARRSLQVMRKVTDQSADASYRNAFAVYLGNTKKKKVPTATLR